MRHHDFGGGRHVLRLDPGDDVIGTIRDFAKKAGISAGIVTGLGSVDVITLGFLDPAGSEYVKRRFEERMEVAGLTGSLSMDGEQPHVHLHAVVSPREFLAYAGHVHDAKVGAVLEVYVTAFPGRLDRVAVDGQAFPALLLPGEPKLRPAKKEKESAGGR
jgi:predicted DNA-binding protein with PD1-like motif